MCAVLPFSQGFSLIRPKPRECNRGAVKKRSGAHMQMLKGRRKQQYGSLYSVKIALTEKRALFCMTCEFVITPPLATRFSMYNYT